MDVFCVFHKAVKKSVSKLNRFPSSPAGSYVNFIYCYIF